MKKTKKSNKIKKEKFRVVTRDFACVFKIEDDIVKEIHPPLESFKGAKVYLLFEWLENKYQDYKLSHAK